MATLTINTDDWTQGVFTDRDGSQWVVRGECDTSRCAAICCQVADWRGRCGHRCELLTLDFRCGPHAERGAACKPISCLMWPLRQADIDKVNELAERYEHPERCHLEVVPWQQ